MSSTLNQPRSSKHSEDTPKMDGPTPVGNPQPKSGTRRRSILAPVAFTDALMPSLQLARSSRMAKRLAVVLLILLAGTIEGLTGS